MEIPTMDEYHDDPVGFVREFLRTEPRPKQRDVLLAVQEHNRVAVRSPRNYGKTTLGAWVLLWLLATRPEIKFLSTAPSWKQLDEYLWREVHKWIVPMDWAARGIKIRLDQELTRNKLELHKNRVAFAMSPKIPERAEGLHARCVVILIDEAKEFPQVMWDALEGSLFGCEEYFYLVISTPGPPIGEFYNIHSRKPGYNEWYPIHITEADARRDVPGFSEAADNKKLMWGEQSSRYRRDVAAEFAENEEEALVPLAWLEASVDRWHEKSKISNSERTLIKVGMDVGGMGASQSVLARLYDDDYISLLEEHPKPDTGANVGYLEIALRESLTEDNMYTAIGYVDVIGIGVGVVDGAKERSLPVVGINVSNKTKLRSSDLSFSFVNLRALHAWRLRERLDPNGPNPLALPPNSDLRGELSALKIELTSSGYKLESKKQFKARFGKSPDFADAVMLCMSEGTGLAKVKVAKSNPFYR